MAIVSRTGLIAALTMLLSSHSYASPKVHVDLVNLLPTPIFAVVNFSPADRFQMTEVAASSRKKVDLDAKGIRIGEPQIVVAQIAHEYGDIMIACSAPVAAKKNETLKTSHATVTIYRRSLQEAPECTFVAK